MEEVMESLRNKIVKIVFKDGEEIRSIRGKLISYSPDFIKIQTFQNEMLIARSTILKIKLGEKNV